MNNKIISLILFIILMPSYLCSAENIKNGKTYEEYYNLYSCNNIKQQESLTENSIIYIKNNPKLFKKVFAKIYKLNDNVNLEKIFNKKFLTEEDKMEISIRFVARASFCLNQYDQLINLYKSVMTFTDNSSEISYFIIPIYQALAKFHSNKLFSLILNSQIKYPFIGLLELLRNNYKISKKQLISLLQPMKKETYIIQLLYYVNDSRFKIDCINAHLKRLENEPYFSKIWRMRDIVNLLSSFSKGREKLEELKKEGFISYIKVDGIYYGTIKGSGLNDEYLKKYYKLFKKLSKYIKKTNRLFKIPEKIFYVDITPSEIDGHKLNIAGWGNNALYMSSAMLNNSNRTILYVMIHEAVEQKYIKGYFSREMGMDYLKAFKNGNLDRFRLNSRIGDENSNWGHPWDSEREWLAEVGSSYILGDKASSKMKPCIYSFKKMLSI